MREIKKPLLNWKYAATVLPLILLTACGAPKGSATVIHEDDTPAAAPVAPMETAVLEAGSLSALPDRTDRILSLEYDLGEESFGSMPYRIRGWLSLPEEGENLPLVLLIHGSHDSKNPDAKLYRGFSYLTDALARRGYAAVSLDVQPAYVWEYGREDDDKKAMAITERQLTFFQRAVRGEKLFPTDLIKRIDLDRLVVVGHSRGGDTALELANQLEGAAAAVAIAPGMRKAEKEWKDIPIAILIPELDGDVADFDGFGYLASLYRAKRANPATATFLRGGNHNFFNSCLTANDAEQRAQSAKQLSPEDQQEFLQNCLADFCDFAVNGRSENTVFDFSRPLPATMYGQQVEHLLVSPKKVLLSDSTKGAPVTEGGQSQRITAGLHVADYPIPLALGTRDTLTFWRLRLGEGGAAELPLTPGAIDEFDGLTLTLAPVLESSAPQSLRLAVEDREGHCAAVDLPPLNPPAEGAAYLTFSDVRVPFSLLSGVDRGSISRVLLLPNQGASCDILVSAVYGYSVE